MRDQSLLSILHLSDFHFTKRKQREQEIVVDALVKDLEGLCIGHRRPDVIMFTGDLVNAGVSDSHDEAYDVLLARVAAATRCSDERIFIVPGNHDLSQSVVVEMRDLHEKLRSGSNDMTMVNTYFDAGGFAQISRKFAPYRDLEQYLSDGTLKYRNEFASIYHIDPLGIDIISINTAMLSGGGLKELGPDEGKMIVPEYAMLEAIRALHSDSYRIFGTHHPFGMMSETGARYLRGMIEEHGNLHLFGHMHDPEGRNITSFKGQLFSDQAGAVFTQRRGAYIGYSLISVDRSTNQYEVHLRTYFDDRKAFDEARDVIDQGRFYSSQESREFWRKIATPVDNAMFRAHLAGPCMQALKAEEEMTVGDKDRHEMFVPPPMKRTFMQAQNKDEAKSTVETPVSFDDFVDDDGNFILYASAEYGRTTVLKELQYRLLKDSGTIEFPRLPIMVDFGDIKQNAANLLRVIKSRVLALPDGIDAESLLKLGHVCLLLDDVVFEDIRRMSILREFVSRFPKVRYVISSTKSSATPLGTHAAPEMPIHFDFIELCVLRRRDMRLLVLKFSSSTDVDAVLDRLHEEFKEINLPFTAANGSILMTIYESQSGFRPINRSVLIEQFIDTQLRKAAIEQSRRETFDYANKTALLAEIAGWMVRQNNYVPSAESVRDTIRAYLDRLGLNAPVDDLMAEFLAARIFLKKPEDRLAFRYRAILEYFIALLMRDDQEFRNWVMDESRYLQFVNELQYYAGKLRNDEGLVDEIGIRFEAVIKAIEGEDGGPIDLSRLASLELPSKKGEVEYDLLQRQLSAEPMSEADRDEELESELPRDVEERQEVFRPNIEHLGQKMIVALILYSGILKNMELIDNAKKRKHLSALWQGWATFLHLSLRIVPDIAKHRRLRINGVLYEISAPHGMSNAELVRYISLNMPVGVTRLVSAALGTEKLERQLVEPELDAAKQPLIYEFLRASLIADLKLAQTPSALKAAMNTMKPSAYLSEAMIWKVAELRRMDRISSSHMTQVAPTLAGVIANLKGGSRKVKDDEKRRQLRRLKHEGVLLRLRRLNDRE